MKALFIFKASECHSKNDDGLMAMGVPKMQQNLILTFFFTFPGVKLIIIIQVRGKITVIKN